MYMHTCMHTYTGTHTQAAHSGRSSFLLMVSLLIYLYVLPLFTHHLLHIHITYLGTLQVVSPFIKLYVDPVCIHGYMYIVYSYTHAHTQTFFEDEGNDLFGQFHWDRCQSRSSCSLVKKLSIWWFLPFKCFVRS